MNYLGHYVFNHDVCRLAAAPYFAMGVALPDLWPRLSRRRRIRWRCVRQAAPLDARGRQLRSGLLNHAAVDRRFHASAAFAAWQRVLKTRVSADGTHPALLDFLGHIALELVLDQHLLRRNPDLADRFYDSLQACDYAAVTAGVEPLAGVSAHGLERLLESFIARRFLRQYTQREALVAVMHHIFNLTRIPDPPGDALLGALLREAERLVDPAIIWAELARDGPLAGRSSSRMTEPGR